jgi:hypothetical protein
VGTAVVSQLSLTFKPGWRIIGALKKHKALTRIYSLKCRILLANKTRRNKKNSDPISQS